MIKELELATKFLGSNVEVTLNEADCVLLGLHTPRSAIGAPVSESPRREPQSSDTTEFRSDKILESVVESLADEKKSTKEREVREKEKGSE